MTRTVRGAAILLGALQDYCRPGPVVQLLSHSRQITRSETDAEGQRLGWKGSHLSARRPWRRCSSSRGRAQEAQRAQPLWGGRLKQTDLGEASYSIPSLDGVNRVPVTPETTVRNLASHCSTTPTGHAVLPAGDSGG
jgi:hypothetical protein